MALRKMTEGLKNEVARAFSERPIRIDWARRDILMLCKPST